MTWSPFRVTGGHGPTEDRDKRVTLTLETSLRAAVRSHSMGSAFANVVRATDTAHVRPELGTPRGGTRRRARRRRALVARSEVEARDCDGPIGGDRPLRVLGVRCRGIGGNSICDSTQRC